MTCFAKTVCAPAAALGRSNAPVSAHTCTTTHIHTCTPTCPHTCTPPHRYTRTFTHVHTHTSTRVHPNIHMCTPTHAHVHTHTSTHTHSLYLYFSQAHKGIDYVQKLRLCHIDTSPHKDSTQNTHVRNGDSGVQRHTPHIQIHGHTQTR